MANVLSLTKRAHVIRALCEGTSIRATARLCGVYKETVMNLGRDVGLGCMKLHDRLVGDIKSNYIEIAECWAFVGSKEKNRRKGAPREYGDAYTMFAIDIDTKLVPSYKTGKRTLDAATKFMGDLRKRVKGTPQISVDGWPHWIESVRRTFGHNGCHLGQTVKEYAKKSDTSTPERKYSPSRVKTVSRTKVYGSPEEEMISTAIAERCNMTSRMSQRRLTRLTNGYSKKLKHLKAAIALHFMYYNFVREHETLKTTPAVKARLAKKPWTMEELVQAALDAGTTKALLHAA